MQQRVPTGNPDVVSVDLSQNLRSKDKQKQDDLQSGGKLNPQLDLNQAGDD